MFDFLKIIYKVAKYGFVIHVEILVSSQVQTGAPA